MTVLTQTVMDYVKCEGACAAGIATVETLAGGPPSADLTYVLPGARSAISFAIPLDQSLILPYLMKEDRLSHERDNLRTNYLATGIAYGLAKYLEQKGYPSYAVAANEVYRADVPDGTPNENLSPDISLRYLAVRSGVAQFGLSGNVLRQKEGAAIILGATVTTAELEPTDPLPKEENYCDDCRLCVATCASGLMDPEEAVGITLGGTEFTYTKRRTYARCGLICGGFSGLHPSGRWSTWSPGRFTIPEEDEDFPPTLMRAAMAFANRPKMEGGHIHVKIDGPKFYITCGNCQLMCSPDKEDRKNRYKMLTESGVVVQNPDGSLEAVSPEEASERVAAMNPDTRALYEQV